MPRGCSYILYLLGGHTTPATSTLYNPDHLRCLINQGIYCIVLPGENFSPMPIPMPVVRKNSMSVKFLFLHIIGQAVPIVPHQSTVVPAIQFLFFLDCQPSLVVLTRVMRDVLRPGFKPHCGGSLLSHLHPPDYTEH